jgi:hypothetical protein
MDTKKKQSKKETDEIPISIQFFFRSMHDNAGVAANIFTTVPLVLFSIAVEKHERSWSDPTNDIVWGKQRFG